MTTWHEIEKDGLPNEVIVLAEKRWEARIRGDYAESDRIRRALERRGYYIDDREDGWDIEPIAH